MDLSTPITNTYYLGDINIEFVKRYTKEYNTNVPNNYHNFERLDSTNGSYRPVEFTRKDPIGYIKQKNKDIWLFGDDKPYFKGLSFKDTRILFPVERPLVVWFKYTSEISFIVLKYVGTGQDHVIAHQDKMADNVVYLYFDNKNQNLIWNNDIKKATVFFFDKVKWNELQWIRLYEVDKLIK